MCCITVLLVLICVWFEFVLYSCLIGSYVDVCLVPGSVVRAVGGEDGRTDTHAHTHTDTHAHTHTLPPPLSDPLTDESWVLVEVCICIHVCMMYV